MCNPFSKPKAPPGPSKEELAAMESSRRNTANALVEDVAYQQVQEKVVADLNQHKATKQKEIQELK